MTTQYFTEYMGEDVPCEIISSRAAEVLVQLHSPIINHRVTVTRAPKQVRPGRCVVINTCIGGFGVSNQALNWIAERKGWADRTESGMAELGFYLHKHRDDPDLVEAVHVLGSEAASGTYAELKVVQIPPTVEWYVDDWGGQEQVHEQHRTWS